MSALGQQRTLQSVKPMSALLPKADIGTQSGNVRFVPEADLSTCNKVCAQMLLLDHFVGAGEERRRRVSWPTPSILANRWRNDLSCRLQWRYGGAIRG
jgi:hypothetical protein